MYSMSNVALDNAALLANLRNAVWGDQTIFKKQLDPGTDRPNALDYLDFGAHLTAIQVIAPTIQFARFLVREEYRHALETFEKGGTYNRGACIMGQPGIGKSCFIAYAVVERLRNKQPIAVQIHSDCYVLFSEGGLSFHSSLDQEPLRLHQHIWTFSDSNVDVNVPAYAFRTTPEVKVFQTTSPKFSRWKEWTKQNMITRYIMDVWPDEEIAALADLLGYDVHDMKGVASKWGPVPRTLLKILSGDDQERVVELEIRSSALGAIRDCRNTLHSIASLDATVPVDSGPSSIFFIRPKKTGDFVSRVLPTIWIPTETIVELLGAAVCSAADRDRQDFFNAMIAFPSTRGAAGFIFQIWIHSFIASGNPIQCQWHGEAKLPSILRLANPGQWVSTNDELRGTQPPFYWRAPPDFEGIDGALLDEEDNVYAIQITIASKHGSPQHGLERLRRLLKDEKRKKKNWRVLFIGHKCEIVSKKYMDALRMDKNTSGINFLNRFKDVTVPVGWCTTSPLDAEIAVVNTLANYVPPESDDEF